MIEFTCDCGVPMRTQDTNSGMTVACPSCGKQQIVPSTQGKVTSDRPLTAATFDNEREAPDRDRYGDERGAPRRPTAPPKSGGLGFVAIAAIVLGVVAFACCVIGAPLALIFPAISKTREAAARMSSANNLKQMTIAMQEYHDNYTQLPAAYTEVPSSKGGGLEPSMGWRVAILPFIEQENLYNTFVPQEPWDGPSNRSLQNAAVKVYLIPGDNTTPMTQTYYQVFVTARGKFPHAAFDNPSDHPGGVRLTNFTDGSANTILITESPTAVPWSKPQDMPFDPDQPAPTFGSHFRGGSQLGMADGSIRFMPANTSPEIRKAFITRDGDEVLPPLDW